MAQRQRMEAMIDEFRIPQWERLPATANGYPYIGATISHLQAIKLAKARGFKNVLIFEDDFEFLMTPAEVETRLAEVLASPLADTYDVVMLGCWVNRSEPVAEHGAIRRALDAQAFSGYIVSERYYDELIRVIEDGLTKLIATHEHWNYMVDQSVKQSQPHSRWLYFADRRIGKQTDREI